ncbi:hypothetical protein [Erythrobacter aurantius]|uniref:hypothetical protein n=1 Tax=Erythrobacter aurantius TaxID=2909249 RepID=UPI00207979B2|nr:hypothetical protein [Erythrobacter aurantius]
MYQVETAEPSAEFLAMWQAAGRHIQGFFQDGLQSWLKVDPRPPFLEHLSFRIGNQVFFIRLEDIEDGAQVPGSRDGLFSVATGWNGHPCLMPMRRSSNGWRPERPGWGLVDMRSGEAIDPTWLVSDERIEVTDWELLDFAVQVVKQRLQEQGYEIMSSHSNPKVHPNIWFISEKGPEWAIVRATRYPDPIATLPSNWREVAQDCEHLSKHGHFAPVAFALDEDRDQPIWRGYAADAQFHGLQRLEC